MLINDVYFGLKVMNYTLKSINESQEVLKNLPFITVLYIY